VYFNVLDVGGNDGNVAQEKYPNSEITILDKKHGWDVTQRDLPMFPEWDVILCNHFIEHIEDPDSFLEKCKLVMTKKTILDIGMPNLSSWYNRIFFLFGYLPQSYEISYRKIYGRFIKDKTEPGGHIRVMNVPSTILLLKEHGFKILSVEGEYSNRAGFISYFDRFITNLNLNLASAFRIKCTI